MSIFFRRVRSKAVGNDTLRLQLYPRYFASKLTKTFINDFRSALGWCQFRCNTLCSEISEDVQVFENFKKFFNGVDVIQVKFEEFASDPFNETRRLFERLGTLNKHFCLNSLI